MRAALGLAFVLLAASGCASPRGDAAEDADGVDDVDMRGGVSGIYTGRLTATAPEGVHILTLQAGHAEVRFALVQVTNTPQSDLDLNITAPDGRTQDLDTGPTLYALPGGRPTTAFGDPPAGDYALRVRMAGAAVLDYEVHWCTPGGPANVACPLQ